MANMRIGFSFAPLAFGICLCAGISRAQPADTKKPAESTGRAGPRLYNKQLDDEAQSALDLAKDLAKGGLFDKELHNVDLLSQQSLARIFTSARRLALQRIAELSTWKDIEDLKDHVGKSLSLNDFAGSQDLANAKTKLSEALDTAKKKAPPNKSKDAADDVFADFKAIGAGADTALAAAEPIRQKLAGAGPATITHADIRAAGELTKLLTQFSDVYDRYKTATAAAATSAGIVDQTRLDLIHAELDHVVTLLKIWARRDAETSQASDLLAQLGRRLDCIRTSQNRVANCPIPAAQRVESGASIEATLRQFVGLAKESQAAADRNSDQPAGQRLKQFTDAEAERKKVRLCPRIPVSLRGGGIARRLARPPRRIANGAGGAPLRHPLQRDRRALLRAHRVLGRGAVGALLQGRREAGSAGAIGAIHGNVGAHSGCCRQVIHENHNPPPNRRPGARAHRLHRPAGPAILRKDQRHPAKLPEPDQAQYRL